MSSESPQLMTRLFEARFSFSTQWSPGTGPFGPLGPPGVGVGVWATIGRVGHLLDTSRAVW